jgi:muconolactone delta-isomerase
MKFLSIGTMKDIFFTFPPAVQRQILEASIAVMNQHKKAGRVSEFYFIPGWGRSVVIQETKSAEEVVQIIGATPVTAFMNIETYPLADLNESMKTMLESLKAAEKMFPSPPK